MALLREELRTFLLACRASKIAVTVIGAERDNEWNIFCESLERFVRQEFPVNYLSEKAIAELLTLLERHKALGMLKDRTREEQIAAFTDRAEKQLLVALHETTFGTAFEKIIYDEYERIEPPEARDLYLKICALHQFGAKVRAGLISRTSGVSFTDFGKSFIFPLKNVVIIEEEKHTDDFFYRSRHQHVSELVFNQVLPTDQHKFDILVDLMRAFNIDYSSDSETWSRMIRGRSVARMFIRVEVGRAFYEKAEELAPNEAFAFQQRAVFEMQHPDGSLSLAEAAARKASERNSHNRSIRNTQAEIARRQADRTNDPLRKQALRRFARERLSHDTRQSNEYDAATRARLAMDELRELLLSGREVDKAYEPILLAAVKEVETTLQKGIRDFPSDASILAIEASFRQLFKQTERARQALERAFAASPGQDWLAIRLSRHYLENGETDKAIATLESSLRANPSSKTTHLEMGLLSMKMGKSHGLILDHLRRSFTPGDNNFEGQFWFARELFLQHYSKDAREIL